MALWWNKTKENFWSEAKLIAAYHILRTPKQEVYRFEEFSYPNRYPRSLVCSWEVSNLKELPIHIQKLEDTLHIQRDHTKFRTFLNHYLKKFRSGKLTHPAAVLFSYKMTQKILLDFLTSLAHFQGTEITFVLHHFPDKQDDFHRYFQIHYPEAYLRWTEGSYYFPFYETLFSLHQLKRINLGGLDLQHHKLYGRLPHKEPSFTQKLMSRVIDERISVVEILPTIGKEFFAYVNQNYMNPISFNLRDKSSQVLFYLASEGEIKLKGNKQAYHYIQQNKRFRLFSRSNISHHQLLDKEDGYIIAAQGVKFKLIDERDLK